MMRKKRYINLIIVTILFCLCLTSNVLAGNELVLPEKSEEYRKWEELPEEERSKTIPPSYSGVTLKNSVKRSKYNQLLRGSTALESKYNLKDYINITVKDQKETNSCWAFATTSVIETSLAKQKTGNNQLYSPMHMEYSTTKDMFSRKLGAGGNGFMSVAYSTNGSGPVLEKELPFNSVYDRNNNLSANTYLTPIDQIGNLKKTPNAKLEDSVLFANMYKSYGVNNVVSYFDSGNSVYTNEQVTAIRNLIKQHVKEDGAIGASMYIDLPYYNQATGAYFCNDTTKIINHMVTIVGWDDSYSVNNFNSTYKPANPGAYIVLNSYGETFGDNGYIYISYDDVAIEQSLFGIDSINENINYDYIYQYDELGANQDLSVNGATVYAANKYTRNIVSQKKEYLKEVGIGLLQTEGVEIYLNSKNDDLNSISLIASPGVLESGYHTIKLAAPIELTGNKFAIVVKYTNAESASLPLEINLKDSGITYTANMFDSAKAELGQSFVSFDKTNWIEINGMKVGALVTLKNTNAAIKGFTIYEDIPTTVPVTGIGLNKTQTNMTEGAVETLTATIQPNNATNKKVTWKSSNTAVAIVNVGAITAVKEGTTTITATTEDGNKVASCNVTVTKSAVANVPVTGVSLNKTQTSMKEGTTDTLVAVIQPNNATNKKVTWKSSDPSVATVNAGVVTTIKEGTTTITATTEDGNKVATCNVTVTKKDQTAIAVEKIEFNTNKVEVQKESTINLLITYTPSNATNKKVTWKSSDPSVATVNAGVVTTIKEGTTTITATTEDGNKVATCNVKVTKSEVANVPVTGVSLNQIQVRMNEGTTDTLVAVVQPSNATNKKVTWKSSNTAVVTINAGAITAIKEGTATITATTEDGNKVASCNVTVTKKDQTAIAVEKIEFNTNKVEVQKESTINLLIIYTPSNATNKKVTWASSNTKVATINEYGVITAVGEGTTTITATTEYGNKVSNCELTVTKKTNTEDDIYKGDGTISGQSGNNKDNTTSKGTLPQTGVKSWIISIIIIISIISTVIFIRYRSLKNVK